jgi:hypothetical protein
MGLMGLMRLMSLAFGCFVAVAICDNSVWRLLTQCGYGIDPGSPVRGQ